MHDLVCRFFLAGWCIGFILLGSGILSSLQAQSSTEEPLKIDSAQSSVDWDNIFEAKMWDRIEPLPLVQYAPNYRGSMSQKTEIKLIQDENYLYAYGKMYDTDPGGVRVNSLYRDRENGDDLFGLVLDSFNDSETAMWFVVNPAGVRIDMEVSNDSEGSGSLNFDWNSFWDAKGRETNNGWEAVMRIPFASLGFQEVNEGVEMGLITYRLIARDNERYIFPDIPPNWSRGFSKPSQAEKVILQDVENQNSVYVTPYALGGLKQSAQLSEDGTEYLEKTDYTYEPGMDVRYPFSSNLTLDFTLNTDFAQVEADDQQLDLERFGLFLPEKRQFFQERANIFDFRTGGDDRLFYSRRIGLHENEPVRILGGGRLSGRIGSWDIGLLNMQTESRRDINLPSNNFGVLRLRRSVFNPYSYAGGILTSKMGGDGNYNIGVGLDGQIRVIGDDYFTYNYAQTFDDSLESNPSNFWDNSLVRLQWQRQRSEGFNYSLAYKRSGKNYEPEMGFQQRDYFSMADGRFSYGYFTNADNNVRKFEAEISSQVNWRNQDGSVQSAAIEQPWNVEFDNGNVISLDGRYWYEDLRSVLQFSDDVSVPEGNYHFYGANLQYRMSQSRLFRSNASAGYSSFYDGTRLSLSLEPTWNISRYLEIGGEIEAGFLQFPERNQALDAYVARFRSLASLDEHLSLQTLLQYDTVNNSFLSNLRFRYNFREGNDLWIVYNENINTNRHHVSPVLPRVENRTLMLKYTHTFGR